MPSQLASWGCRAVSGRRRTAAHVPGKRSLVPCLFAAAVMAMVFLLPVRGHAQSASVDTPEAVGTQHASVEASLSRAALRGLTLKALSAGKKIAIYYAGTGSLYDTGLLVAISTIGTYAIYVGNEYWWDTYTPAVAPSPDGKFDATESAWRTTFKYLTLKPTAMAFNWAILYAYTGSVATMVVVGSANSLTGPISFYLNNMGWDWYDWYARTSGSAAQASVPGG